MYIEEFIGGSDLKGIQPKHIINCMKVVNDIDIGFTKVHSTLKYAQELVRDTYICIYTK